MMASTVNSFVFTCFLLYLATSAAAQPQGNQPQQPGAQAQQGVPGKKWCVPKPEASDKALQEAIDYVCSKGTDCKPIQPGGVCYEPNNVRSHAQYAMNAYYNANGAKDFNCDFKQAATLTTINPSQGKCVHA